MSLPDGNISDARMVEIIDCYTKGFCIKWDVNINELPSCQLFSNVIHA